MAIWRRISLSFACGAAAALPASCAGSLSMSALRPPIFSHLLQLVVQVLEVEVLALLQLARELLGLLAVDVARDVLDQRQHVAHAEDARGDALGLEELQRVGLLAGAHEQDGLAGDLPDRQCGAAAGVAVRLGQHDAGQRRAPAPKARAALTASWPAMLSTTNSVSVGATAPLISRISTIISSSTCRRPAVSTISTSNSERRASASASRASVDGGLLRIGRIEADFQLRREPLELQDRRRVDTRRCSRAAPSCARSP